MISHRKLFVNGKKADFFIRCLNIDENNRIVHIFILNCGRKDDKIYKITLQRSDTPYNSHAVRELYIIRLNIKRRLVISFCAQHRA